MNLPPLIPSSHSQLGFIVAGLLIAFVGGWQVRGWAESADQLAASEQRRSSELQAQQKSDQLAARLESRRAKQAVRDRVITQEIADYAETTPAADRCNLPLTWCLRHDAAATGTPTDPARLSAGSANDITDAAALETIASNYQTCREWRSQLIGWQAWWWSQASSTDNERDLP